MEGLEVRSSEAVIDNGSFGHRIIKFAPTLDRPLLQLGVTGQKGADAHHLNLPNGIVVMRNGNVVVTDGEGCNYL